MPFLVPHGAHTQDGNSLVELAKNDFIAFIYQYVPNYSMDRNQKRWTASGDRIDSNS